jgi:hypothetical protein
MDRSPTIPLSQNGRDKRKPTTKALKRVHRLLTIFPGKDRFGDSVRNNLSQGVATLVSFPLAVSTFFIGDPVCLSAFLFLNCFILLFFVHLP